MLDLAAVVKREFERAMDEAAYLRLDLSAGYSLARGGGRRQDLTRPGRASGRHTRTRTRLGGLMLALCRLHRLPRRWFNEVVECHERDFVWPNQRLIVETDGCKTRHTAGVRKTTASRDLTSLLPVAPAANDLEVG